MENKDLFEIKKKRLLDSLIRNRYLKDKRLIEAFLEVPLEEFIHRENLGPVPYDPRTFYEDRPNMFYFLNEENYRTISAPHMISIMLQGLALEPKDDLLILGAKSGYIAALAHKLAPQGKILILEANSDIAKITTDNLTRLKYENIEVVVKNPLEGMKERAPWKKILVTGAIKQERIYPLLDQLDPEEGVLYAPIGEDQVQIYTQILRVKNEFFGKKQLHVRFTPLMTQLELDELELITDFDDIEIIDDPDKVDQTLSRIEIKYSTSLIDDFELGPKQSLEELLPMMREIQTSGTLITDLKEMKKILKTMKRENDIEACFNYVESLEEYFDKIKDTQGSLRTQKPEIRRLINEIRTYNIVRKDLENSNAPDLIEKKIEIIKKQIGLIIKLEEIIKKEIQSFT